MIQAARWQASVLRPLLVGVQTATGKGRWGLHPSCLLPVYDPYG